MPNITLDAEAFKVLASDTRLQILKSLDERPKTVSELSREMVLNKATVHEHLQQLVAGDLIKKNEREGRKWVYYTLSWKGKSLLHPENTTVFVLLGLALAGSAGALVQLGNWLRWWGAGQLLGGNEDERTGAQEPQAGGDSDTAEASQETARAMEDDTIGEDQAGGDGGLFDFLSDGDFWIFAALLFLATALVVLAMVVKQRARGRTLGSIAVEPAVVGAIKAPGQPQADAGLDLDEADPETDGTDPEDGGADPEDRGADAGVRARDKTED